MDAALARLGVRAVASEQAESDAAKRALTKRGCGIATIADRATCEQLLKQINEQLELIQRKNAVDSGVARESDATQYDKLLTKKQIVQHLLNFLTKDKHELNSAASSDNTTDTSFFGVLQQQQQVKKGLITPFEAMKLRMNQNTNDVATTVVNLDTNDTTNQQNLLPTNTNTATLDMSSVRPSHTQSTAKFQTNDKTVSKHTITTNSSELVDQTSSKPRAKTVRTVAATSSKPTSSSVQNDTPLHTDHVSAPVSAVSNRKVSKSVAKRTRKNTRKISSTDSDPSSDFEAYDVQADLAEGAEADDDEDAAMNVLMCARKQGSSHTASHLSDEKSVSADASSSRDMIKVVAVYDDSDLDFYLKRIQSYNATSEKYDTSPDHSIGTANLRVPTSLWTSLFPYQQTGLRWLIELHQQKAGGIIADEMGLGKTVQVVALLAALKYCSKLDLSLVICPATMMSHWVREIHRWYPPLRVVVLHESSSSVRHMGLSVSDIIREALGRRSTKSKSMHDSIRSHPIDILVTTYEGFRNYSNYLLDIRWGYAILDEGHRIRNPTAGITRVVKQISTVHRLILTGAPIQNHLRELWSLFDFVFPGRLGSQQIFETQFAKPIAAGGWANASPIQAAAAYQCALVLRDLIRPYLLRRMKKDVHEQSNLPPKTEQVLFCRLSARQRRAYRSFLRSREVADVLDRDVQSFRALGVLRKLCNHPELFEMTSQTRHRVDAVQSTFGDIRDARTSRSAFKMQQKYRAKRHKMYNEVSVDDLTLASSVSGRIQTGATLWMDAGKLRVAREILLQWYQQGHRALVFTQGRQMLDILQGMVQSLQLPYMRMDGTTPVVSRQALVDQFNDEPEASFCFLLTTKVGGIGVNLTGADRVMLYDPDWNPSTDAQARERAWRLGQKKPVTVYRLISQGTIEEKIYQRQVWKLLITTRVLHNPNAGTAQGQQKGFRRKSRRPGVSSRELYDSSNLRELFTLDDDGPDYSDEETNDDTADISLDNQKGNQQTIPLNQQMKQRHTRNKLQKRLQSARSAAVRMAEYKSESESDSDKSTEMDLKSKSNHLKQQTASESTDKAVIEALFNNTELSDAFAKDALAMYGMSASDRKSIHQAASRIASVAANAVSHINENNAQSSSAQTLSHQELIGLDAQQLQSAVRAALTGAPVESRSTAHQRQTRSQISNRPNSVQYSDTDRMFGRTRLRRANIQPFEELDEENMRQDPRARLNTHLYSIYSRSTGFTIRSTLNVKIRRIHSHIPKHKAFTQETVNSSSVDTLNIVQDLISNDSQKESRSQYLSGIRLRKRINPSSKSDGSFFSQNTSNALIASAAATANSVRWNQMLRSSDILQRMRERSFVASISTELTGNSMETDTLSQIAARPDETGRTFGGYVNGALRSQSVQSPQPTSLQSSASISTRTPSKEVRRVMRVTKLVVSVLKKFGGVATSQQILNELGDTMEALSAALVREILRTVATLEKRRNKRVWRLKEDA